MRKTGTIFAATLLALAPAANAQSGEPAGTPAPPHFAPTACPIDIPAELAERITCGTVSVPRDYENPQDGDFAVMVLVGRAATSAEGAAPLYLDFGGWSASNVSGGVPETQFRATTRDVVLIDKRGAGFSSPQMCPPTMLQTQIGALAADLPLAATLEVMRAALLACRADLAERQIKPAWFGVRTSSRDLDRVRRALGHERIALLGGSNGGRQALDYLAAYPQHVAAAVVDSPALPDPFLNRPSENFDRALAVTAAACAAQPDCAARFPDLADTYRRTVAALDREGLAIPFPAAPGGAFVINGADFELLLQQMLYRRQGIAMVPAAIAAAEARQGAMLSPVIAAAQANALANGEITGHVFECRERPSLQDAPPVTRGSDILGDLDGVCASWTKPGPLGRMPENSPVPVLVLAGGFDPVTPPAYARIAAEAIGANARFVEVGQAGHGAGQSRCMALEMIPAFLDDPQADPVMCETPPITFVVPPAG